MSEKIKSILGKIKEFFVNIGSTVSGVISGLAKKASTANKKTSGAEERSTSNGRATGIASKIITPSNILMAIHVIVCATIILVSYLGLKMPIVSVCLIVILESLLAALLGLIPIWVHGLIIIAQIVAGILAAKLLFMILMAVVYVAAIVVTYLLPYLRRKGR